MGFSQTDFQFQCCFATYKVSYDKNDITRRNSVAELFVFIKSDNAMVRDFTYLHSFFFTLEPKHVNKFKFCKKLPKIVLNKRANIWFHLSKLFISSKTKTT